MKAKHDESKAREAERQKRKSDRDVEEAKRDEEAKRAALPIIEGIESGAMTVARLTKVQMCMFFAAVPVGMRTKKKEDLLALVKAVPRVQVLANAAPPLPPPQQAPPPPPPSP